MSEYIEREALIESFNVNGGEITYGETMLGAIISRINLAPTADVVEVVRCKDCKHFGKNKEYRTSKLQLSFCDKFHHNITRDNDFCSYGVRKEGAEE